MHHNQPVIGLIFLRDRKDIDLQSDESAYK